MDLKQKTCTKCSIIKNLTEFHPQKRGKYGRKSECKSCNQVAGKAWRDNAKLKYTGIVPPSQKLCPICQKMKPTSSWTRRKLSSDGLFSWCRDCTSAKALMGRRSFMGRINDIKSTTPCKDCNQVYPFWVMQFDHLPEKGEKVCMISTFLSGGKRKGRGCNSSSSGKKALLEEIKKCEIVCANCHATRTYKRKPPRKQVIF